MNDVFVFIRSNRTDPQHTFKIRENDEEYTSYCYNAWSKVRSTEHLKHIVKEHNHVEFRNLGTKEQDNDA